MSDLFREETTARNVTEEAGVPTHLIDWREPTYVRWQSIIEEARRREMIPEIIKVARRWYEESLTLKEAVQAWELTLVKPVPKVPVEVPVLMDTIETIMPVIAALRMTVIDQEKRIHRLEEINREVSVAYSARSDEPTNGEGKPCATTKN